MLGGINMLTGIGAYAVLTMVMLWLGVITFVVWLVGVTRSVAVIKLVHTVVFVLLSILLAALLYEVVAGRMTVITWSGVTLFTAEGMILIINNGRCPLTTLAEDLGSDHGQITDTLLPKWFADRVFRIYGVLFAGALVLFVIRLMA